MVKFFSYPARKNKVSVKAKLREITAAILTAGILFSMAVPVMAAGPGNFTDIPDNWSRAAIEAAVADGLLTGSGGRVMPSAELKRCEMAAIINRAFGAAQKGDISKFTDIPAGKWYAEDMAKAVRMGTFSGSGSKMRPEDPITRQEAFAALARALKLSTDDYASLNKFSDRGQVDEWAKPGLSALAAAGYISGSGGGLNPLSRISRAEFAQVMHNVLKTYIKTAGTYTSVAEGNVMINVPGVTLKGLTVKGDLIIGDGVGTGDVTLDAVKVEGRTVVRGGGKNSVHVINGSTINGTVIIDNVNNEVRIVTDQGTTVRKIEAGSQVVLEGSFGDVKVVGDASGDLSIEIKGNVQTLAVEAEADITLTSGTIKKVDVTQGAGGTTINAAQGTRIETVTANARADITGDGTVVKVEAKANDVKVDTIGTKVTADQGVTGVTAGGNAVAGGSTVTTAPVAPATGGGSGGSSGNDHGNNPGDNPDDTDPGQSIAMTASDISLAIGSKGRTSILASQPDATIRYSSSNADIAVVDPAAGEITGVATGVATITATASRTGYHSSSATFKVYVTDAALHAVSDKTTAGMYDPENGQYYAIDIDLFGDKTLAGTEENKKEGFHVVADGTPLAVSSVEINGAAEGAHDWIRVNLESSLPDFESMQISYDKSNANPVLKLDDSEMPAFYLDVFKSGEPVTVADAANPFSDITKTYTNSYSFDSAGTYGPATAGHAAVVVGDVIVKTADVTLRNMVIKGNLIFGKEIGDGNATINNVTVLDHVLANGGGSSSIHIQGTSSLGVVEIDDQREDKSEPINIEAEGTGSISAVSVKNFSAANVTADTDSIGFVAAEDGSSVSYSGGEDNVKALLDKIVAKADYVLDNSLTPGPTDASNDAVYQKADIDSLVSDIIDISDPYYKLYQISYLKYYINPLEGAAGYKDELERLSDKLVFVQNTVELIGWRDDPETFTEDYYDRWFPGQPGMMESGYSQFMFDVIWSVFDRYVALKGYDIEDPGEEGTPQRVAYALDNRLQELQSLWTVDMGGIVVIDKDESGTLNEGDTLTIKFKRQLEQENPVKGWLAINSLVAADPKFGDGASVEWRDDATFANYNGRISHVSECTVTMGDDPDTGLLGGEITVPRDELGSYIPEGSDEYTGEYGPFITDEQPKYDIVIGIPDQMVVARVPALDAGSTRLKKGRENEGTDIERGDSIEIAFTCKLAQASIEDIRAWVNNGNYFGEDTGEGGKTLFQPGGPSDVTRLGIQFGSDPLIRLSTPEEPVTFTIPKEYIYDPTGLHPAEDIVAAVPGSFTMPPPGGGDDGGPAPAVEEITVIDAVYNPADNGELTEGDKIIITFGRSLDFGQMDGISLAFAANGNVFGIPAGTYANRNDVPGVSWNGGTAAAIILQPGFTLRLNGSNDINYSSGGITVNRAVTSFTDGVSDVVVEENGSVYDVYISFYNAEDAGSSALRDALTAILEGTVDGSGSSGNTVKITDVAADKIGPTLTIPGDKTERGTAFGFTIPATEP